MTRHLVGIDHRDFNPVPDNADIGTRDTVGEVARLDVIAIVEDDPGVRRSLGSSEFISFRPRSPAEIGRAHV